jgi:hypothetical protein
MSEILLKDFKLRLVNVNDAEFIVSLRTDSSLSKHLHATSPDVSLQEDWIRQYKIRESKKEEYYFLAESYDEEKLGTTRLYNFSGSSFELGSWVFKKGLNEAIPILADLTTRDFAYETLGFQVCKFNVRKENKTVVRYHKLFTPELDDEDELNYYFKLDYQTYLDKREKIKKMIL